jgi:hypothetical protein
MRNKNTDLSYIFRGKVVSNKDPKGICRIKVRVPSVHGASEKDGISDKGLPFAMPCSMSASFDAGTFIVPEVGSTVFVFFEGGEPNKPIYIGGSVSYEAEEAQYYGGESSNEFTNSDNQRLKRAYMKDTPSNVYKGSTFRKAILFKSRKGSSIELCDEDDNEHLSIIDRLGQCFYMFSPVDSTANSYGMANRGIFTVLKNTYEVVKKSILLLKSLSSSFLRFVSDPSYSKTDLTTVYKDDKAGISIDVGKDNKILVHMKDKSFIEIKENTINIQSKTINIKGNLNVDGNIYSSSTIRGNVYGTCPCKGINGYNHPVSLNLSDINPYVDDKDENDITE